MDKSAQLASVMLPPLLVKQLATRWLEEDLPSFDIGGAVAGDARREAKLIFKHQTDAVLAGRPFFDAVFETLGCSVTWSVAEGSRLTGGQRKDIAIVAGPVRNILIGERPALNCLQRTSAVATATAEVVDRVRAIGWRGSIAATRKTTPGFRLAEKYAVCVGGGDPHRYDLSSMVMLKDNHIDACGGKIHQAVSKARSVGGFSLKIEVETRSEREALEAVDVADIVMLDNFLPSEVQRVSKLLKERRPSVLVEVSGGVCPENVASFACPDVDVISMGCLTQYGGGVVDFSLKIVPASS